MKKRFLFLASFLFNNSLFSFATGNPAAPALLEEGLWIPDTNWSNPQAGGEGDYLFNKKFSSEEVDHVSAFGSSQQGFVNWTLFERFSAQAFLGTGDYTWQWQEEGELFRGVFRNGFLWRVDGKLILFEVRDTSFALDGQVGGWGSGQKGNRASWTYWQASFAITQNMSFFAPYLGVGVNQTEAKVESGLQTFYFQSSHSFGVFGGGSFVFGRRFSLNVEWRQGFEQGLSVSGQARF